MQQYFDQLSEIVADPTSNLVVAALLLAAVTVIILVAVLAVLIFMLPGHPREDENDKPRYSRTPRAPRKRRRTVVSRKTQALLALGVLFATLATVYGATSDNDYCANTCHVMKPSVESWYEGDHRMISCVRCHEGRIVLSLPTAATSRIRQLAAHLAGRAPAATVVPSERCLTCHAGRLAESFETSAGVIVSHAEPLAAGIGCSACHVAVAHATDPPSRATIMTQCLQCHDGKTASAECATCHSGDPGMSPVFDRIYSATDLPQPTCGGCHSEQACDACHGIRMPHSQAFIEGEHARDAGFYKKEVCWNCHLETECFHCHGDFDRSHPDTFFSLHKELPRTATCSTCHRDHQGPFCDRCH